MTPIEQQIEQTIVQNIPDAKVLVLNPDGEHFEAVVISASFNGVSLLKQHQAVMKPLTDAFKAQVHALALKTFSEEKWAQRAADFPTIEQKLKEKYNG